MQSVQLKIQNHLVLVFQRPLLHKQDVRILFVIAVATYVTELKTLVFLPKVCLVTTAVNLGILLECAYRQAIKKDQNRKNTSQDDINKRTTGSRGEIRYVYGASLPAAGESSWEDEYVFQLGATGRMPHAIVKIGDFPVDLIVDSGATVNVLDNSTFLEINAQARSHCARRTSNYFHMDHPHN